MIAKEAANEAVNESVLLIVEVWELCCKFSFEWAGSFIESLSILIITCGIICLFGAATANLKQK